MVSAVTEIDGVASIGLQSSKEERLILFQLAAQQSGYAHKSRYKPSNIVPKVPKRLEFSQIGRVFWSTHYIGRFHRYTKSGGWNYVT